MDAAFFRGLPHERVEVPVNGCTIVYRRIGPRDCPKVVLIHGAHAHGGWWSEVGAQLANCFDVIVPDLSGCGESGHRNSYSPDIWTADITAILRSRGIKKASIVGHSMGGKVAISVAAAHTALVQSLVLIDTRVRLEGADPDLPRGRERRAKGFYVTREEALRHFRLTPGGTTADVETVNQIAEWSIRREGHGWTWKFDPAVARRFTDRRVGDDLRRVTCPVGYIFGRGSCLVGADEVGRLAGLMGRSVRGVGIDGARHHVPLDAPDSCARAISRLLRDFEAVDGEAEASGHGGS